MYTLPMIDEKSIKGKTKSITKVHKKKILLGTRSIFFAVKEKPLQQAFIYQNDRGER